MSIFFAEGNISDSGSQQNQDIAEKPVNPSYDFGDDYTHNEKRKVETEKDKKWNIIKAISLKLINSLKIDDFQKGWNLLQQLVKQVQKAQKIIQKEGRYPSYFLKALKMTNQKVLQFIANQKKRKQTKSQEPQQKKGDKKKSKKDEGALNKNAATALNTMRQKLKNTIMPIYQKQLQNFNQVQDLSSEQESEASESSSQDEDQNEKAYLKSNDPMIRRKYFLKRQIAKKDKPELQDGQGRKQSKDQSNLDQSQKPEQTINKIKSEDTKKKYNINDAHIKKKIQIASVKEAQNKMKAVIRDFAKCTNNDDRQKYIQTLDKIMSLPNQKDFQKLSFLLVDIPIRIQVFRQMKLTHFERQSWQVLIRHVEVVYNLLRESEQEDLLQNVTLFNEGSQTVQKSSEEKIYKGIQAFLIILQNQLKKAFMFIDKNQVEYAYRLQDLIKLIDFMYKVSRDMSFHDSLIKETTQLSFKVIQNMYFMSSNFLQKIKLGSSSQLRFQQLSQQATLQQYAEPILRSNDENLITKTILYLVFNHAVNQREKSKELLIMSNIPQIINNCDYYTQSIYNRCIVQIGINSFHYGNYYEVQQFLSEICSYGKNRDQTKQIIREFLAQGYSRTSAQKDIPRNKILPYYLHLNVELIESLELIASMILQIPYTLSEGGRITSKTFKKVYYEYERSHFIAEPLNNRDLIYAASVELKKGNWKQCYNRLTQLQIWGEIENVDSAHKKLLQIIKQYSLKCYLLANRKCFKSISLENLAAKFELEDKNIRKLICKWLYSRQLQGSITSEGYLVFVQKRQSEMQKICENLYSKLQQIRSNFEQQIQQRFVNVEPEEQEGDKQAKVNRRFNLAMNEKLKAYLSKKA